MSSDRPPEAIVTHDLDVMWVPWDGPGLEHLRLAEREGGVVADGLIVGVDGGLPFRVGGQACDWSPEYSAEPTAQTPDGVA